jgi:hypothetical protein
MKERYILLLFCIILLFVIFNWIHFLSLNNYVVECFTNNVDLPLTNKYSCQNFCNPSARCAVTGQQCLADIDCPGCKLPHASDTDDYSVLPNNSGGKMTGGMTPQYSYLTNGFGTNEQHFQKQPAPNFGVNIWKDQFEKEKILFDKKYKPNLHNPNYPERYTLTSEFLEDGPLPSNY